MVAGCLPYHRWRGMARAEGMKTFHVRGVDAAGDPSNTPGHGIAHGARPEQELIMETYGTARVGHVPHPIANREAARAAKHLSLIHI